jgi:hypothetical protein
MSETVYTPVETADATFRLERVGEAIGQLLSGVRAYLWPGLKQVPANPVGAVGSAAVFSPREGLPHDPSDRRKLGIQVQRAMLTGEQPNFKLQD